MKNNGEESGTQTIHSVSQLTDKIKVLLEDSFPFIWITGEISNFSTPMSGHHYFSLKDESSQISAVMFRGQNRHLKFKPENGMAVTGLGRISLYKPRGSYQIIFEYLEPKGVGALQVAFEQLKTKLSDEGLFDEARKRPIPFLPQKIALITSPTGAVLQDMLNIARRRFENMSFVVAPVRVQGDGAVQELVQAVDRVNRFSNADVAIVARGGGSLEDLQAFNSESLARAISGSRIPIVSAVGHETDYTISDFVADLRAPTPSAAAEIVVPQKHQLEKKVADLGERLRREMDVILKEASTDLKHLTKNIGDPLKKLQDMELRCDDMVSRLLRSFRSSIDRDTERLRIQSERLAGPLLLNRIRQHIKHVGHMDTVLNSTFGHRMEQEGARQTLLHEKLCAMSPLSVLDRGYSITLAASDKKIVRSHDEVSENQALDIILSKGGLRVTVNKKTDKDTTLGRYE